MTEPTPLQPTEKKPADILEEILGVNKEIAKELKFIENYFRWQAIWSGIKWLVLIAIIVLGFISLKAIAAYLQSYGDVFKSYSDQLNSINSETDNLKNLINLKGR